MSAAHTMNETPLLKYALYYARLGWSVVPAHRFVRLPDGRALCSCKSGLACISKGKHPALPEWKQYQTERASEDQIRAWFTGRYSDYSVGIITGAVSGIFVVDVDEGQGKPGAETLSDLQMINGDLPHTVTAMTGGGGRHLLFRHPGSGKWIGTAKNVLGPGVDIRGDGGFIVAAPSLHESGRYYLWNENAHPESTDIAEAPGWVVEASTSAPSGPSERREPTGSGEIIRDSWGKVTDGRERHMIGIICGVIASILRKRGALPSAEEVFQEAWPSYERTTRARGASLEADGRGETLMQQRIVHMLRRAESGKWRPSLPPQKPEPQVHYDPETGEVLDKLGFSEVSGLLATPLSELDLDHIPPRRWIYGRELVRGYVSVLASPGGTGKTAYTMAVGTSIAWNKPLLAGAAILPKQVPQHCMVHRQGRVWFYNLEDPMEEMRRRIKATLKHHSVPVEEVGSRIFIDSGRDKPLIVAVRADNGDLVASPIVEDLVAELKRRQIDLLVVDPFVQSHSAEENRNEEMNLVMALWGRVAHRADCSIWLVHHFRKGGKGGDAESIRGAGAIQGAARSMFTVSAMTPEEANKLGINPDERWQYIRHDNAKQNMAPPAGHATWFKLASVSLNNGTEDYPEGDFVQAVEAWQPPSPWDGLPWTMIERILRKIDQGPSEGEFYAFGKQSKDRWAGRVLMDDACMTDGQAMTVLKAWKDNGVLEEGQYASPKQKGGLTGCVRVNQVKFSEMKQVFPTKDGIDG